MNATACMGTGQLCAEPIACNQKLWREGSAFFSVEYCSRTNLEI